MTAIKNTQPRFNLLAAILLLIAAAQLSGTGDVYGQTRRKTVKKPFVAKKVEKTLPDLKLPDLGGAEWSLRSNLGKVVLINFWATWCAPCRKETPMLVNLSSEYKSRGLEIVGITLDEGGTDAIKKFVADYKIDYPVLLPTPGSRLAQIDPVPTTLLIDSQNRLVKKYVGLIPEKILRADLDRLTGGLIPVKDDAVKNTNNTKARNLTILHTNDIHGHLESWQGWDNDLRGKTVGGLDRLAAQIRKLRGQLKTGNVLLLDAGDTIGDTMIAAETEGRAVIETMNAMRYDAMVVGNHEPDFTASKLLERIKEANFPVLAANISDKKDNKLFTKPYIIKTVGGTRVGIFGLAYPNTPLTSAKKNVDNLIFRDSVETAREYVPRLRKEGAEIVVALTHLGLNGDKRLAEEVAGIDVIVGGHSHNRMTEALRVRETLIVQAGAHGSDLGRLDLTVENGRITAYQRTLIPITNAESDKTVKQIIERQIAPFKTKLAENIGQAQRIIIRPQTIAGNEPEKRDAESPADSLFADAIREETKSEIAFLPGLGYGVAIQKGAITESELRNLIPHDAAVFTMKLTGAQIREVFEQAVENVFTTDATKKVGGMIQISGARFSYDPNQSRGERVKSILVGEKPLDSARIYTVAVNALLAEGGHNQKTFLAGTETSETGKQFEIVRRWIARRGEIIAPPIGRITKLAELKK